jgi:hypothetical protein
MAKGISALIETRKRQTSSTVRCPQFPGTLQNTDPTVADLPFAKTEIAEAKGDIPVGVEFCEEPSGVAVGGEELHDGFEVYHLVLMFDGVVPRASVFKKFLALGGSDEWQVFDSCVGGPQHICRHSQHQVAVARSQNCLRPPMHRSGLRLI